MGLRESVCCGGVFWLSKVLGALLVKPWGARSLFMPCEQLTAAQKLLWAARGKPVRYAKAYASRADPYDSSQGVEGHRRLA